MSDGLTMDLDTTALVAALNTLGVVAQPYVNEASRETAAAMVSEAQGRLHRQLGPNATGQTEAGITSRPAYDGNGYVVVAENPRMPNLPLWIEKGTHEGRPRSHTATARPFFYASAMLEVGAHEDRLREALSAALSSQGLGE